MDEKLPKLPILPEISNKKRRSTSGQPLFVLAVYSWTFPVVLLIAFIAGIFLGYFVRSDSNPGRVAQPTVAQNQGNTPQNESPRQQMLTLLAEQTRNYIGNEEAAVRMYEFSDFRCPYCARYNLDTGKKIFSKYVDTGKVYLGFVHLAILGDDSVRAALASECAAEQQKFWEYHDLLFTQRQGGQNPDYSSKNLKALAEQLNLNIKAFSECLDSGRYTATVLQQTQFANQMGLTSTPSFLINGKAIIGAQPYEVFEGVIEEALRESIK